MKLNCGEDILYLAYKLQMSKAINHTISVAHVYRRTYLSIMLKFPNQYTKTASQVLDTLNEQAHPEKMMLMSKIHSQSQLQITSFVLKSSISPEKIKFGISKLTSRCV